MQFTIDTLDRLKSDTENMRTISDEIKLFTAFADIESAFEPIEECWFDLVAEFDRQINLAVDAERTEELFFRKR